MNFRLLGILIAAFGVLLAGLLFVQSLSVRGGFRHCINQTLQPAVYYDCLATTAFPMLFYVGIGAMILGLILTAATWRAGQP